MKEFEGYAHTDIVFDGRDTSYVLSVMIDVEKEGYPKYWPSLTFYKNYGLSDEECLESWDNSTYIYYTLYENVILPWCSDKQITAPTHFAELINVSGVCMEDFEGIKRIFEHGIAMGFFKELEENGTEQN